MSETNTEAPRFAIEVGTEDSASASFNPDGSVETNVVKNNVGMSFNQDGTTTRTDFGDDISAEVDADLKAAEEEEGSEAGNEAEPEAPSAEFDLPDFDPENEEVSAQYKERYLTEDGSLNFEAFNKSFYGNLQAGKTDLNANERAFVKQHMKVSDEAIDVYLNGVASKVKEADEAFYSAAGGKETYDAMFGWAVGEGGYTQAQKERFNAALKAGGSELDEQVELLKTRYAASGKAPAPKADPKLERRKSSPSASATSAAPSAPGPSGPEPFASLAEFNKAQAAAHAANDIKAMREVDARMRASPKLWKR